MEKNQHFVLEIPIIYCFQFNSEKRTLCIIHQFSQTQLTERIYLSAPEDFIKWIVDKCAEKYNFFSVVSFHNSSYHRLLQTVKKMLLYYQSCYMRVSGADFWQNRGFNDKSVKTSKIVHLDLLIKIGYGPIA